MDLEKLYAENAEFKEYVDNYSRKYQGHSIDPHEALSHELIRQYAEWLKERGKIDA